MHRLPSEKKALRIEKAAVRQCIGSEVSEAYPILVVNRANQTDGDNGD